MNSIKERGLKAVNLAQFAEPNSHEFVSRVQLSVPNKKQYILRMLIKAPFQTFQIPSKELGWLCPLIAACEDYQLNKLEIRQPFCYVTVRSGFVESVTDDEWHTDGFSVSVTHLPEQNYCWSNIYPTEFVSKGIEFPKDFSPLKHNVHSYIQDVLKSDPAPIETAEANGVYCFDPYVIHRRPQVPEGVFRTFVRVSFTPIEIVDCNNTLNPFLPRPECKRDAVKEFRNKLERYPLKKA
jgi:hypothetical protein